VSSSCRRAVAVSSEMTCVDAGRDLRRECPAPDAHGPNRIAHLAGHRTLFHDQGSTTPTLQGLGQRKDGRQKPPPSRELPARWPVIDLRHRAHRGFNPVRNEAVLLFRLGRPFSARNRRTPRATGLCFGGTFRPLRRYSDDRPAGGRPPAHVGWSSLRLKPPHPPR
jgi:hypothetical protein